MESARAERFDPDRLLNQAFTRATGSRPVGGNRVRLLRNASENYPAWLEAIASAQRWIHFESYIIHSDRTGWQFAEALAARARDGVRVSLLYDWWGARGVTGGKFWRYLRRAGVEVRCFNPPFFDSPLGWLRRDHRKMLAVDGRTAFVTGLCVGDAWVGDPARGIAPWRDTGIQIEGPAIVEIERAFASTWGTAGTPLSPAELPAPAAVGRAGDVTVRVVASFPSLASLLRFDQVVAGEARHTLWLTDAYFVATTLYVQALRAAAADGVDVRVLVPGATDIPGLRALSRSGYRSLLEGGIRVFEWNGPMLHAKTAVADGRWSRVGSTNLNPVSWLGNWELDVAIEDAGFAEQMEAMYLDDLQHATEVVLSRHQRVQSIAPAPREERGRRPPRRIARATAGAIGIGSAISAATARRRPLGPAEAKVLGSAGLLLLVLVVAALVWPHLVIIPLSVIGGWFGIALLVMAWRLHRGAAVDADTPEPPSDTP
ncbi:MAG TPA: phospholipase D-like domain-containing protein [Vicinamibacterales bacterium]|nr:phospholipase D-like domain-containing protein [Vicinamibacterales bacterium]